MDIVKDFMLMPEIMRFAVEYGSNVDDKTFQNSAHELWLKYEVDGEVIGLIDALFLTGAMCEFHPYILRKHRAKFDGMIQEFFKWFVTAIPEQVVKLNAWIVETFKGTIKAAERANMTLEGRDRSSYRTKNGVCDRLLFGITREEIA